MSTTQNNSMLDNISKSTNDIVKSVGEQVNTLQQNVSGKLNEFSNTANTSSTGATPGFTESNGIIAKFAFFILAIICFLIALNLGIRLISYFMKPSNTVYVINGMISGTTKKILSQNPKDKDSKLIRRSNNETTGIEFTWSAWLRLDGVPTLKTKTGYQNVFVKGDGKLTNAPGVYISDMSNNLRIMMDTASKYSVNEKTPSTQIIDIPNIPMQKFFHLIIRCQNKYLDVYINGLVVYRTNLINVPIQNYDNVIVCNDGGFIGKLSNLIYYERALNSVDINALAYSGPNMSDADGSEKGGNVGSSYLSTLWYQ